MEGELLDKVHMYINFPLKLSNLKKLLIFFLLIFLYFSSAIFKVVYESKKYKKEYIADLSSEERFLSKNYVGAGRDTYHYLKQAYSVYKTLKPFRRLKTFSGYLFAPFLFIFKNYSILAIIFFNVIAFSIVFFIFLNSFNVDFKIKLLLIFFVFLMTFYYIPRIMLEAYGLIFTLLAIIFFRNNRFFLSLILLFLVSLIRSEFFLVFTTFLIFTFYKSKRSFLFSLPFGLIIIIINYAYEDKSNFYYWAVLHYYGLESSEKLAELLKEQKKQEIIGCKIIDKKIINIDCYKNIFNSLFNEEREEFINKALKNILLNPFKILIFPIEKYRWNVVYLILNLIWFALVLISILRVFKEEKVFVISLFLLVLCYALVFIFGGFDASRFKLYILPFELTIILSYLNKRGVTLFSILDEKM